MLKVEKAQKLLRDNPHLTADQLHVLIKCSKSYAYQLIRDVAHNGKPPHRGPLVRRCEEVFGVRPEIIYHALKPKPISEIAEMLSRKIGRPVSHQYINNLVKVKIVISKAEMKRIRQLCK